MEHGHQGDSWIWIFEGVEKVAIDTFSSMKHELKAEKPSTTLAIKVIDVLSTKYQLVVYSDPEVEPHEDI